MNYIERLRALRVSNSLTQQQVAQFLHMERSTYTYYENGHTKLSVEFLLRLADFYRVSVAELLGERAVPGNAEETGAEKSRERFSQLSNGEQELLLLYRSGTTAQREALLARANELAAPEFRR